MAYIVFKTFITSCVIVLVSEISKRFSFLASLLTALPLTSILIFIWMYIEQKNEEKIAAMSLEIFYLVIPSLVFFLILPLLIKKGFGFYGSFGLDILITYFVYLGYIKVLNSFSLLR